LKKVNQLRLTLDYGLGLAVWTESAADLEAAMAGTLKCCLEIKRAAGGSACILQGGSVYALIRQTPIEQNSPAHTQKLL
jgi:hypothetical protein